MMFWNPARDGRFGGHATLRRSLDFVAHKLAAFFMFSSLKNRGAKVGKHIVHQEISQYATDRRTLDLGCGQSPLAPFFANRVGLDIVPSPGLDVVGDAHFLPFASAIFDQIVCSEVLEHLADPKEAVREMARVLNDNGILVLSVPFVYPVHEAPHDYQRFTVFGLRRLFAPLFEIQEIRALYTEEQTIAILLQRIVYQRQNSVIRRYLYLAIANLLFRSSLGSSTRRYQNIARTVEGPFLTAGYLLVARKRADNLHG